MDESLRNAKEPVTIRLDLDTKGRLQRLAEQEGRTVSSLIDEAVKQLLDRRLRPSSIRKLKVRHAALIDTSVLRAYSTLGENAYRATLGALNLAGLEFIGDRPEWRRLPTDVFSGESDLVESVNWLPIWWHMRSGGASPRLDWPETFLQMFVGHHVFVRRDLVEGYLGPEELTRFEQFASLAKTGREASLRSMFAWARHSDNEVQAGIVASLDAMWRDAVVGCQLGTDYHIAVRRVAAILAKLLSKDATVDPPIPGLDSLDRGFQDFRNGTVTAFTGGLLHSAALLSEHRNIAYLLAGPADLRVPSLNTLAGPKGMFNGTSIDGGAHGDIGKAVMGLWRDASSWFRDEVVDGNSDDTLRAFVSQEFPDFLTADAIEKPADAWDTIAVLKSLMQTWVKWFTDPDEAKAFLGEGPIDGIPGHAAVIRHYQELSDRLNPSGEMIAPDYDSPSERAIWKFPVFAERPLRLADATKSSEQSQRSREPARNARSARS